MKIGYLKNLGRHELEQASSKWQTLHENEKIDLESVGYDEIETKTQNGEVDAVLANSRDDIYQALAGYSISEIALLALVQAGNLSKYQQTAELDELKNVPRIIVASVADEKSEYHHLKDILRIKNDPTAVETLGEAILMVESGSSYLMMSEMTASRVDDDQMQKSFLLKNGKQLREKYVLLAKSDDARLAKFSKIMKKSID